MLRFSLFAMKVDVVPYRSEWLAAFDAEASALWSLEVAGVVEIHHIGSTSVVGLAAKPVIDILMAVEALEVLDDYCARFESLGYVSHGEFGIPGRRFYSKGGYERTHHIHAFGVRDSNLLRHLAFRDYLRVHTDVCAEYAALKLRVAAQSEGDIERYCDGKDRFIKLHEARALNPHLAPVEVCRSVNCS